MGRAVVRRLLRAAGAVVVKVESKSRPDGTRRGNRDFFDWMNGRKLTYAEDFGDEQVGLRDLLSAANVVIEASRPSALERRGLTVTHLPPRPGQIWIRITAHGSIGPASEWIGFGDDCAVAGGLVAHATRGPVFCGDAIADPLTGLESALAVVRALRDGGGGIIDVALSHVAAEYAALAAAEPPDIDTGISPPHAPRITEHAHDIGVDNATVDEIVFRRLQV